jgi:beta-barrel assembly-enhancing protease
MPVNSPRNGEFTGRTTGTRENRHAKLSEIQGLGRALLAAGRDLVCRSGTTSGAGHRPRNRAWTGGVRPAEREGGDCRVVAEAQPRYNHPFKFFVVHETQPNAFATPGGNVYVVDSLFYFVKNTEQLAGTLCHEVSHTIHRDAVHRLKEQQRIERRELGAALLLGPSLAQMIAIQMLGDLHSLAYSRDVESKADVTGSDICAATGYNPWGLVWLFEEFQNADTKQIPQLLSDHPANGDRIKTLRQHFHDNPSVFAKFDSKSESATPLVVPKNATEQFVRP